MQETRGIEYMIRSFLEIIWPEHETHTLIGPASDGPSGVWLTPASGSFIYILNVLYLYNYI